MKNIKQLTLLVLFVLLFTSCSVINKNIIDVSTDFQSLTDDMVDEQADKLKKNLAFNDVILVSDFVNLDNLQNHSKLGFLLSDALKNSLSQKDVVIRQVELGREFTLGKHGFNILTRKQDKINSTNVDYEQYAMVGTYSVTTKRLIVFIKLIDIRSGHILSSSTKSVILDNEIRELEATKKEMKHRNTSYAPLVL